MALRIITEPQQGASYDQLLVVARTAEECGFDARYGAAARTEFFTMITASPSS
jgi:hypothetical protein